MRTIGSFVSTLDQVLEENGDVALYRRIERGEVPLSYRHGRMLANTALRVIPAVQDFMEVSRQVPHDHVGSLVFPFYSEMLDRPAKLRALRKLSALFDSDWPISTYSIAAVNSLGLVYAAIYTMIYFRRLKLDVSIDDIPYETKITTKPTISGDSGRRYSVVDPNWPWGLDDQDLDGGDDDGSEGELDPEHGVLLEGGGQNGAGGFSPTEWLSGTSSWFSSEQEYDAPDGGPSG